MSIIPYPHQREIVLRHKDSVVVYDPASRQLVVRRPPTPETQLGLANCPYCHRPLRSTPDPVDQHGDGNAATATTAAFASPEYFRMLQHSVPGSQASSRPPSPRRRLTQPVLPDVAAPLRVPPAPPRSDWVGGAPRPPRSESISATAFLQGYFQQFFIEERELGRGGHGVVLLVKHVLDGVSLGHFALKRQPVGDNHAWLTKVLVEVQLLQHLSHQNLVSYRHVWLEDYQISAFGPSVPCLFLLQQYCDGGDLQRYINGPTRPSTPAKLKARVRRRSKHPLDAPTAASATAPDLDAPRRLGLDDIYSFFRDITSGLHHLHAHDFVHRDLKPSNCLLHLVTPGAPPRVLVSDFGEVRPLAAARASSGATGTLSWCAPETLRRDPRDPHAFGNFTPRSDVFALGMILHFLCFASLPYRHAHPHAEEDDAPAVEGDDEATQPDPELLREEIAAWAGLGDSPMGHRLSRPELPDTLYRFLRSLLAADPNHRPPTEAILRALKTGARSDGDPDPVQFENELPDRSSRRRGSATQSHAPSQASRLRPTRRHDVHVEDLSPDDLDRPTTLSASLSTPSTRSVSPHVDSPLRAPSASPPTHLVLRARHRNRSPSPSPSTRSLILTPRSPPLAPPRFALSLPFTRALISIDPTTARLVVLLLKAASIGAACSPVAARPGPAIALLVLAAVDVLSGRRSDGFPGGAFWGRERPRSWWWWWRGWGVSALLAFVHLLGLWMVRRAALLCVPRGRAWEVE